MEIAADRITESILALGITGTEQLCPVIDQDVFGQLPPGIVGEASKIDSIG